MLKIELFYHFTVFTKWVYKSYMWSSYKHFYLTLGLSIAQHWQFFSTLCVCLHTIRFFQVLLYITNNSIKYQSFLYAQLNGYSVLFLTIQFSISLLFALSLDDKQFYLIHWPYQVLSLRDRVVVGAMAIVI